LIEDSYSSTARQLLFLQHNDGSGTFRNGSGQHQAIDKLQLSRQGMSL